MSQTVIRFCAGNHGTSMIRASEKTRVELRPCEGFAGQLVHEMLSPILQRLMDFLFCLEVILAELW